MHHFSFAVQSLRVFLKFLNFSHCRVHQRMSEMGGQEEEMVGLCSWPCVLSSQSCLFPGRSEPGQNLLPYQPLLLSFPK